MYMKNNPGGLDAKEAQEDAKTWVLENRDVLCEPVGGTPPRFSEESTEIKLWLSHHIEVIEKIIQHHRDNMDVLIDHHGTATSANSLHQLWENVGQSPDTDAAKHFVIQASRYMAKEMVAGSDITAKNLAAYVGLMRQSLKALEGGEGEDVDEVQEQDG